MSYWYGIRIHHSLVLLNKMTPCCFLLQFYKKSKSRRVFQYRLEMLCLSFSGSQMPPRPSSVQSDGILHSSINQSAVGQERGKAFESFPARLIQCHKGFPHSPFPDLLLRGVMRTGSQTDASAYRETYLADCVIVSF